VRLVCGSATYAPQGGLASVVLGQASGFAGVNLSHTYNSRLQPSRMQAWSTGGNAQDMTYGFNLGAGDNGNVVSVTNNLDGTRSQNFTYDQLNRLKTAQTQSTTGGNCWGLSFTYDNWANLTAASVTQCSAPMLSIGVDTKNRVTTGGFSYDLSGNVTADGSFSYTWNAESEMKTAAGVTYAYDGLGNRVSKSNGKLYWYGMGSSVLDESDLSGNITNEYVYFGGQRIARRDASGNVYYYVEDMLGTSRALTTSSGTVCYDADFYPFGGERTPLVNTCPQNFKFNGKERDPETGLDDFGARYFSSSFGRWLSPDWSAIPAPVPYANLTNPQTLNLYQFVGDSPETFSDLDGHEGIMAMSAVPPDHCKINACSESETLFGDRGTAGGGIAPPTGLIGMVFDHSQPSGSSGGWINGVYYPPQNPAQTQQQNQTAGQRAGQVVFGQVKKEFPGVTFDQNNVQVLGAHNGHENIVVTGTGSKDQIAQVQKTLQQSKGLFGRGSRINITIGKGTFALHVERVSATSSSINFQSHIDRGNPNSGVRGFFTHVFVDGFVGAVFHPHDPGLDPQQ
jgi:RHS repeat-associated protein